MMKFALKFKNNKKDKSEKKKKKEINIIKKFILKKLKRKKQVYVSKRVLKKKFKNAETYTNTDFVSDKGIINLKDGTVARVFSVDAIDLSLTSNIQKNNFFNQLKYLYQVKGLNLRMYKLDDKIDLNANKDYYNNLIDEYSDDEDKIKFLTERKEKFETLEAQNLTTTSRYYFVLVCDNEKILENMVEQLEMHCTTITPRININMITNNNKYEEIINLFESNKISLYQDINKSIGL